MHPATLERIAEVLRQARFEIDRAAATPAGRADLPKLSRLLNEVETEITKARFPR